MQTGIFSFSGTNKTWKAIEESRGLVDSLWSSIKPNIKSSRYACKRCLDTGVYPVNNGPDDFDWEGCECGISIENAEREYINRM